MWLEAFGGASLAAVAWYLGRQSTKQRERELESERDRFHDALSACNAGVWTWEIDSDQVRWDATVERIHGIPEGSFGGNYASWERLVTPETLASVERQIEHTFATDAPFEPTMVLRDDPDKVIQVHGRVRRSAAGKPIRMSGICEDISLRHKLKSELEESVRRFRVTFDETGVGVAHIGLDGSWLRFNSEVTAFLGYTTEELLGLTFQDITHPDDLAPDTQRVADLVAGKIDKYSIQKRYYHADGHVVWANLTVSLVRQVDGEPEFFISVIQDICEEKRLEEELINLNRDLESRVEGRTRDLRKSNESLEQFAYIAAHDLQEPLRTISSYLSLLEMRHRDALDDEAREFISIAVDGAIRMRAMVSGVLEYSSLRYAPNGFESVALELVAKDALASLQEQIKSTGALVELNLSHSVKGNRTQLVQLFQNLIGNAFRYAGDSTPHVTVTSKESAGKVAVEFVDRGVGIAPEHQVEVFQLFRRLHPKGPGSGTGLGLAICKQIVENHRGHIELESVVGEGSTFRVFLDELGASK